MRQIGQQGLAGRNLSGDLLVIVSDHLVKVDPLVAQLTASQHLVRHGLARHYCTELVLFVVSVKAALLIFRPVLDQRLQRRGQGLCCLRVYVAQLGLVLQGACYPLSKKLTRLA